MCNPDPRFEAWRRQAVDDGWNAQAEPTPAALTRFFVDSSRTVINRNDSPDVPFSASINPYRGCEHGCSYCFARPTHAYLGLSPGLDFETKIAYKADAAQRLREELAAPSYRCETIALGVNTDAYQPAERRLGIARGLLEVLAECQHPVVIVTKSALVLRDIDLLSSMARRNLAEVVVSVTTLDRALARSMEPRAAAPHRRLEVIGALTAAGVPTKVLVAPVIPALNDHDLERILTLAREAGALSAGYILLRLPAEVKDLFYGWMTTQYASKVRHVASLMQQTHGGRDYDARFGQRMRGSGEVARLIERRFELARTRLGLSETGATLETSRFVPPRAPPRQLALF